MAPYKFTQINWKLSFILIFPVLLFQLMQDYFGFGWAMLLAILIGLVLGFITIKFFKSVVEFRDSYLLVQKGYFGKTEKIPYAELEKLTYSNATRFIKFNLYTNGIQIELPPPPRFAQAKELFAWLHVKNPATAFEIIQPKPALD